MSLPLCGRVWSDRTSRVVIAFCGVQRAVIGRPPELRHDLRFPLSSWKFVCLLGHVSPWLFSLALVLALETLVKTCLESHARGPIYLFSHLPALNFTARVTYPTTKSYRGATYIDKVDRSEIASAYSSRCRRIGLVFLK
jgi:hypothetical protein